MLAINTIVMPGRTPPGTTILQANAIQLTFILSQLEVIFLFPANNANLLQFPEEVKTFMSQTLQYP